MKRIKFAVLVLATVASLTLAADVEEINLPPPTPSLSLEALVAEALENNPELQFYQAEIAAAKAGRKSAGLLANPELSGDVGQKRVSGGGLASEGVAWSVTVMQPFEWPGRMSLRKAIANRDVELAELGFERFKLSLAGRVRTLGYGLFAAEEKSAAAGEVAKRFQALREVLVQRDPAGLAPLLETRVIEATELNAQRKASDALLATRRALLELNQLRGIAPDTRLMVNPTRLNFRSPVERQALLASARTNNFELRARAVELAQQGLRVDLARNERFPALRLGPTVSQEQVAGEREQTIGLAATLPLPLWNRNGGNIAAEQARQLQAEVALSVAGREIGRQVLEAALTYETKLREMSRWRPDSVQHFKEAADLADRHYRLGAVPISTYVELQAQYLDAVESLLDTKREALEAATRLEWLTGLPLLVTAANTGEEKL
jgi:cobalt-zinc-cadmium efflux system outer membrane protein